MPSKSLLISAFLTAVLAQSPAHRLRLRQAACSDLELVIARGTDEPNAAYEGQFGVIVGDPLYNATKRLISGVTGYAVNYPASSACNSSSLGVTDTINHLNTVSAACPNQKFALAGYSQGAGVVHTALQQISPSLYPAIIAVVQFGDPTNRAPLASPLPDALTQKERENCAFNEPVCTNNGSDFLQHLSYNNQGTNFINGSAAYIQKQFESDGTSGPDDTDSQPPGQLTQGNIDALNGLRTLLNGNSSSTASACPSSSSGAAFPTGTGTGGSSASGTSSSSPAAFTGQATTNIASAGTIAVPLILVVGSFLA